MKFAEAIKFDEDLLIIVTLYLKYGGEITDEIIIFYKDIIEYIKKNEGITLDCFEFLNIFILKVLCKVNKSMLTNNMDPNVIYINSVESQYTELITLLLKMISKGYSDKTEKKTSQFLSYNLLCILLQVIKILF